LSNGRLIIENGLTGESWKIQAKKIGFIIEQGKNYSYFLITRAEKPGKAYVALQREIAPWDNFGLWDEIDLDTEWTAFSLDFTANQTLNPEEVRFAIMIGETTGKVYVDLVGIEKKD